MSRLAMRDPFGLAFVVVVGLYTVRFGGIAYGTTSPSVLVALTDVLLPVAAMGLLLFRAGQRRVRGQ